MPSTFQEYMRDARAAMDKGRFGDAEASLALAAKDSPHRAEPHFHLGLVLLHQSDTTGAAKAFQKAVDLDPALAKGHFALGKSLLALGDPVLARQSFRRARELTPISEYRATRASTHAVSVVMASTSDTELLNRTLEGYARQSLTDFELILVDQDQHQETLDLAYSWQDSMDLKHLRLGKTGAGNHLGGALNAGLRTAFGELIVRAVPQAIPGVRSLELMHNQARDYCYVCCKAYFLTPEQQERLDSVDWRGSNTAVRGLAGFYSDDPVFDDPGLSHTAMEAYTEFNSWLVGGFSRSTWSWFGGFSQASGPQGFEQTHIRRRTILGLDMAACIEDESLCILQHHPGLEALTAKIQEEFNRVSNPARQADALEGFVW